MTENKRKDPGRKPEGFLPGFIVALAKKTTGWAGEIKNL